MMFPQYEFKIGDKVKVSHPGMPEYDFFATVEWPWSWYGDDFVGRLLVSDGLWSTTNINKKYINLHDWETPAKEADKLKPWWKFWGNK